MKLKYINTITASLIGGLASGIMVTAYMKEKQLRTGIIVGLSVAAVIGVFTQIGYGSKTKDEIIAGK